jgi:ribose 5-phosphate isomerase B
MKIAIGADHAGFALKEQLKAGLAAQGLDVTDFGTMSAESTDYPDYAEQVARAVSGGDADVGFLVCSTGVGMSIAANKVPGIRAALAYNEDEVALTRSHNNANVLAFGAKYTTPEQARRMAGIFLATPFEGGRHERRVNKIAGLEQRRNAEGGKQ